MRIPPIPVYIILPYIAAAPLVVITLILIDVEVPALGATIIPAKVPLVTIGKFTQLRDPLSPTNRQLLPEPKRHLFAAYLRTKSHLVLPNAHPHALALPAILAGYFVTVPAKLNLRATVLVVKVLVRAKAVRIAAIFAVEIPIAVASGLDDLPVMRANITPFLLPPVLAT